ncbi:uncharacterized protein SCHCODRAFT_0233208 [Schizophyllum commune H4-8]|uniref:F-box domain-containing protein n=1 Tax=Schizophyllum commune (strain H4-8 / FGSC 9210) TaxID=578458 RepID=D8PZ10_SCHCM|nr:uncharacterized protein SCHCODRAFT_0233208 [Schizophyllum commune H4-8]KAI5896182.1 hypothetical protein SCHCODRAFT_0233208 [Schizophyllum commune H4-8]
MHSGLNWFPTEIWTLLLNETDRTALCSIAATSLAFRRISKPILFHRIVIRAQDKRSIRALPAILPDAQKVILHDPWLAGMTASITASLPRLETILFKSTDGQDVYVTYRALCSWLRKAPALRQLELAVDFDDNRHLRQALVLAPSLRRLVLYDSCVYQTYSDTMTSPFTWLHLEEVVLGRGVDAHDLDCLLPQCLPSLKSLYLPERVLPGKVSFGRFLPQAGNTLLEFHIELRALMDVVELGPLAKIDGSSSVSETPHFLPHLALLRICLGTESKWRRTHLHAAERLTRDLTVGAGAPIQLLILESKATVITKSAWLPSYRHGDDTLWQQDTLPASCTIKIVLWIREVVRDRTPILGPVRAWQEVIRKHIEVLFQTHCGVMALVELHFWDNAEGIHVDTECCVERYEDSEGSQAVTDGDEDPDDRSDLADASGAHRRLRGDGAEEFFASARGNEEGWESKYSEECGMVIPVDEEGSNDAGDEGRDDIESHEERDGEDDAEDEHMKDAEFEDEGQQENDDTFELEILVIDYHPVVS